MSAFTAAIPFSIDRVEIAPPTAAQISITTVPNLPLNTRKFEWTANSNAKFYEVWIGKSGAAAGASEFIMVSAYVTDENTFYASLPAGDYRIWLRAISHEESIEARFLSAWSTGVAFSVS